MLSDFLGYDGKSLTRLAGARRFNRGVQSEDVRLEGNRVTALYSKSAGEIPLSLGHVLHSVRGTLNRTHDAIGQCIPHTSAWAPEPADQITAVRILKVEHTAMSLAVGSATFTAVTDALRTAGDIRLTADLLVHSDIRITQGYTRESAERLRNALTKRARRETIQAKNG